MSSVEKQQREAPQSMQSQSSNQIQVSLKKDLKFFGFLAKIYLKEFQEIELHALGEAISQAVQLAENLERNHYAKIIKINQFIQEMDDQASSRKKLKIIIILTKIKDSEKKE